MEKILGYYSVYNDLNENIAFLVEGVVLGTADCVSNDTLTSSIIQENSLTIQEKNNINWYNYDIKELLGFTSVEHTYDAKDNFYAYANDDRIQQMARFAHLIPDSITTGSLPDMVKDSSCR